MQAVQYSDGRRELEVFHGKTQQEIYNKMRTRFAEQEKSGEIISLRRSELTHNQLKRLRKKGITP